MSKSHNDLTAHEKELSPGTYARFPLAGRPELRKRVAELEQRKVEAYLVAEEERVRREAIRERQALACVKNYALAHNRPALSRGRSRSDLRERYLTPAAGRLF
jgi:hypothetical protein